MGEETARLREEIEQTRQDLTRDVDRLAEKTSPTRIVDRRVQRTKGRLVDLKEKIMGSSDTPRPATYGPTYTDDVYGTGYDAGYGTEGGGSRLDPAKESVTGAAQHVTGAAQHVTGAAQHAAGSAQHAAVDAVHGVRERAEGSPLAAGAVAFGVGWLLSSLLPASDREAQAAQAAGDAVREHGGPVLDQARQAAQEVGEELRDHVQDAAQQVKERTQEAAGTVREEARSSTAG